MTKHLSEAERRAQILKAARAVFIEKGYLGARVQDVAHRAGLSKGAVYFYFQSKRELFMALVHEEHEATYSFLDEAERDPRPAAVKLKSLVDVYLDYFAGLTAPPRFFLMMSEEGIRDEDIQEEVQAVHQHFVDASSRLFAQGIAEGTFAAELDPMAAAQLLKALVDGLMGEAAVGIRPDRELLASHGLRILLTGLLARPGRTP